ERSRAEAIAHAPLRDHLASEASGARALVLRPPRPFAKADFLSNESTEPRRKPVDKLASAIEVTVFLRQESSETAGHTARYNADLVRRVRLPQNVTHKRVSPLVVGDDLLLFLTDHSALTLRASYDAVDGFVEFRHLDFLVAAPRSEYCPFVDQIR